MKKIEILMRNWSFSYLSNHDLIIFISIQFCSVKKSDSSVEHFLNYWTTLFMGESSIVDSRESCTSIPQFWYLGIEVTDQSLLLLLSEILRLVHVHEYTIIYYLL